MRTRRTGSEIMAEVDGKIAYHDECIKKLQDRKDALMQPSSPRIRKTSMRQALGALKEAGLTPDEIVAMVKKTKKLKDKQRESND